MKLIFMQKNLKMLSPTKLRDLLVDTIYQLEKARIWNGMDWAYNPLHPIIYLPVLEKLRKALKEHDSKFEAASAE